MSRRKNRKRSSGKHKSKKPQVNWSRQLLTATAVLAVVGSGSIYFTKQKSPGDPVRYLEQTIRKIRSPAKKSEEMKRMFSGFETNILISEIKKEIDEPKVTEYREAKNNLNKRVDYLKSLIRRLNIPKQLTSISYVDVKSVQGDLEGTKELMSTYFDIPAHFHGSISSFKIIITRSAFETAETEGEFLSILRDHEFVHIKYFGTEYPLEIDRSALEEFDKRVINVNGDLFVIMSELEAYKEQMRVFPNRTLSKKFVESMLDSYNDYREYVKSLPRTPLTSWMLQNYPEYRF